MKRLKRKNLIKIILFLSLFLFSLSSPIHADSNGAILSSISPQILDSTNPSQIFTINGESLDSDYRGLVCGHYCTDDNAFFHCSDSGTPESQKLQIIDWTNTSIRFRFPEFPYNNNFYKNDYRQIPCQVHWFDGVDGTAMISYQIELTYKPIIESIDYNNNASEANIDDEIKIKGKFFGRNTGSVTVNGVSAQIGLYSVWNKEQVVIEVPNTSSGNIILTTQDGFSTSSKYLNIIERCNEDTWECGDWGVCSSYSTQRRSCNMTNNCRWVHTPSPETSRSCTPECTEDTWSCGNWSTCSMSGRQSRSCTKTYDCPSVYTSSPSTTQYCEYIPQCTSDSWSCGGWGLCSPSGIQTRNCNKIYDCPSVETASPATSQYCEAPNRPQYQTPSDDSEITNQSSIIKATVKLICPVSQTMASQGSGTIINSDGTILTNKHVVNGTAGCLVGFIDNYNNEPYFADRHIAEIDSMSSNADIAILKLRNPYSRKLTSINITGSNSNNLSLGNRITTYGYPAKFGTKITYTSGDFSGVDGNYLKTTAVIEYGNSGGGAYLKNGTFIGIPTAVMKGELNSLGYILSVNKINSWLNNSPMAYNYNDNNSYARVSILEDIDLSTLDSLDLFIFEENQNTESNQQQNNNSSNGSLVRAKSTAGIYLIESGNKRPIKSAKIFLAKGYKWGDVTEVSQAEMNNYPLGTDLTIDEDNENKETPSKQESAGTLSNGALVRVKGTHGVYLIHNNQKRPIKSATIFLGRGYKWGDVVDVEQSVLNTYPLGENVALSESITTENETQTITINVPRLRTRSLPSLDGKIITLVLEGDSYDVISEQNGWYKINYESGKTGWVMSMYTK